MATDVYRCKFETALYKEVMQRALARGYCCRIESRYPRGGSATQLGGEIFKLAEVSETVVIRQEWKEEELPPEPVASVERRVVVGIT